MGFDLHGNVLYDLSRQSIDFLTAICVRQKKYTQTLATEKKDSLR
jgi:hypothetical protein